MPDHNPLLHPRSADSGEFVEVRHGEATPVLLPPPAVPRCDRCDDESCLGWRCSPVYDPDIPVGDDGEPAYRCGGCGMPLFNDLLDYCGKTECHPGFDADYERHMEHEMWLQENADWFRDY